MSRIYSNALGNVSYREWLQDRANNGSSGEVKRNAQRLLQVVGNDGKMGAGSQVYSTGFDTAGNAHQYRHDYDGLQKINNAMLDAFYSPNAQFGQNNKTGGNIAAPAVGGGMYGGGGISAAEARNQRFYNALLESLGGRKAADSQRLDAKYRNSLDRITQKRDTIYENLDNEQAKLDSQRLGAKLGIPQNILATYDRIIEAIKSLFNAQDYVKQFYAQAETGKFRNPSIAQNTAMEMAYKISQDQQGDFVEVNENIFANVLQRDRAKVLKDYLRNNLRGNSYELNYGRDGEARITNASVNKISNPRQDAHNLNNKGQMISELPDILTISQKTGWAPDGKNHSFARDGFEYRQSRVKLGDEIYTVNLNVGLNQYGKILYEINDIKKEGRIGSYPIRRPSYDSNISQIDENVKYNHAPSQYSRDSIEVEEKLVSLKPKYVEPDKFWLDMRLAAKVFSGEVGNQETLDFLSHRYNADLVDVLSSTSPQQVIEIAESNLPYDKVLRANNLSEKQIAQEAGEILEDRLHRDVHSCSK